MTSRTSLRTLDHDAIVVGAGFAGIYMLHKLRNELGLSVQVFDKAPGIGGTWYWNRYPGALSDSLSHIYCYSFDEELMQEWELTTRYLSQPQVLSYLEHVVDRHDLRRDIQLETAVTEANFDEGAAMWTVSTSDGQVHTARFFVTAMGVVHEPLLPDIKGRETFAGVACHTSLWPEGLDWAGKRVGVIGTGSSGTQVVPAVAPEAEHVTVFIRSPQFSVPIGNRSLTPQEQESIKANYPQIWADAYNSNTAFGIDTEMTAPSALDVSEEDRNEIFQHAWDFGGPFHFMIGTFNDIITNPVANDYAASFIRDKIREIIKDPNTAKVLTPTEPWARRPVADNGYYEAFNRENVTAVPCGENPITEITPAGVRTADGVVHELDILVFATGFDGITGPFNHIDIRGRSGRTLTDEWKVGAATHLGVSIAGFPNMFTIYGPYSPFANNPPLISVEVEFVTELIQHAVLSYVTTVEATKESQDSYVAACDEVAKATIMYSGADSWINGGNIPGKPRQLMFNMGGLGKFRDRLAQEAAQGYPGYRLVTRATASAAHP